MLKILTGSCVWLVQAASAESQIPDVEVMLSVKPRICVLAEGETSCSDTVTVKWYTKNKNPISVCLYKSKVKTPLLCWDQARSGKYTLPVETPDSFSFLLRTELNTPAVAQQDFEVVQDNKRYRRSRRNPWSFF